MGMLWESLKDPEYQGQYLARAGATAALMSGSALAVRFTADAVGTVTRRVFREDTSEGIARAVGTGLALTAAALAIDYFVPEIQETYPADAPLPPTPPVA